MIVGRCLDGIWTKNLFRPKIFGTQILWDLNLLGTQIFWGPKFFEDPTFFIYIFLDQFGGVRFYLFSVFCSGCHSACSCEALLRVWTPTGPANEKNKNLIIQKYSEYHDLPFFKQNLVILSWFCILRWKLSDIHEHIMILINILW